MSKAIDVTIVISTYNRCESLPIAIDSALAQETDENTRYEIIVVDNNSQDATRAVVESYINQGHDRLRYVFEPRQGLSNARNAGLKNARGSFIAYTDDDVHAAPDWVVKIKQAFARHPEVDYIGGKVLPIYPQPPPAWLTRHHWAPLAITDYGDEPIYVDARRPWCLVGANLSIRREVFDAVGTFDPAFLRAQDHEWQIRLWQSGRRGLYVPDVVVLADVQSERLTKAYHRRWHRVRARYCALMRLENITDSNGELIAEPDDLTTIFGAPGFTARKVAREAKQWAAAVVKRRAPEAFFHEGNFRYYIHYLRESYRHNRHQHKRTVFAELREAVTTTLSKRMKRLRLNSR